MKPLDLQGIRATKARLGERLGKTSFDIFMTVAFLATLGAAAMFYFHVEHALSLLGVAALFILPALWWKYDLSLVAVDTKDPTITGRLSRDALIKLSPILPLSPQSLWQQLQNHWQIIFICNHLLILPEDVGRTLSNDQNSLPTIWERALQVAGNPDRPVEVIHIAMALLDSNPGVAALLTSYKLGASDLTAVEKWLDRELAIINRPKQSFGGIGRDWANGFTPTLNQFGHNISLTIEAHGTHFGSLVESPGVLAMRAAFAQNTSAIALIGPDGIGKTSHSYALAQNLLAEHSDQKIAHQQIIALEASAIISAATRPGQLEYLLGTLLNEAVHAGNIVLFFDDAQLFFRSGPGSFDATQILLPVLQSRAVRIIFAMSPHDYQQIKSVSPAFAGLLSPVVLQEPDESKTLEVVADSASNFEIRQRLVITYAAVKEAYRLSGRYELDMAYPGKAIRLLEQSLTHAIQQVVTAESVQAAIEQATGVKAGTAAPAEASQLLQLEDAIHQRMINQTRAVSVVANALRRARAGVSNPNRPIGSFLFLGPTGVGKTELAKAIASTYYGAESNMIRLDMSEYQQESDVTRLLSGGEHETSSLIMRVRQQPFSVVLLDEIEKAHPNILNLLLQLLDEGKLTDATGRAVSFKDAVVIATSNAGADTIRERVSRGEELESIEREFTDQLISSGQFRPELLNRFDEIVLFRPLKPDELGQVVRLMLAGINQTLHSQNISVELTDGAIAKIVEVGNDPRLGARPMRRALQRAVENTVAGKILRQEVHPGDRVVLDAPDLTL